MNPSGMALPVPRTLEPMEAEPIDDLSTDAALGCRSAHITKKSAWVSARFGASWAMWTAPPAALPLLS